MTFLTSGGNWYAPRNCAAFLNKYLILNGCNHRVSPGGFLEALWIYSVPYMGAGPQKFASWVAPHHDFLRFIHLCDLYGNCGINVVAQVLNNTLIYWLFIHAMCNNIGTKQKYNISIKT